ncbi:Transglutaminase-like enzyme, predicted cysteine protease [Hyella patelloides LEGE 07179]|uniref:Transglutaminase-like enzyme, predicted cysteine protease n=1 Tax=Hyella patelloides LEGE 07179 TaxID=945734 RepID=A0A563VS45_9CYAN|nr:transglutaminase-like domain-containing protein [Hyella patelloides]VEP14245.1 Transglutaminase-like enzyme, predicted cysteine protease [Hyella patelloides LEGE 07179]
MQLPKFFLGTVIMFWGWQTGLWMMALPMALIYEISSVLDWRWHFTTKHFRQVSNLCTVILVIVLIYLWNQDASLQFIFLFFQWLPVICFPLLAAQAYSDGKGIDIRALLFLKEKPQIKQQKATILSLHYPFLAICLISASAGNTRDIAFYVGLVTFLAIALWFMRSHRNSAIVWISIMLLAATMGFFGHLTLHNAHLALEKSTRQWIRNFYHYHSSNPTQRSTAIGDIGAVKLTNKIVLRVKPDEENLEPKLLRRVTYNNYISGIWLAVKSEFEPLKLSSNIVSVLPEKQLTQKGLDRRSSKAKNRVIIYRFLEEGKNLLNLPDGTQKIEQLPVEKVEQNQYGTVQVQGESRLATYKVTYERDFINDGVPTEEDLEVPKSELPAIKNIVQELNLQGKSEQEILDTVYNFFNTNFTYSLQLARQGHHKTPLSAFLLENRSGHCEYFATATALLLRAAGIPTRYAIGYSVHEYSSLEKQFIVRGRNAHAWNLVYINGAWQQFDTTPSNWIEVEDNNASSLVIIKDFFSWLGFKIAQFSELVKALTKTKSFWFIVIPILLILLLWLLRKRDLNGLQLQRVTTATTDYVLVGADSEIYLIEKALQESGYIRNNYESWQQWLIRLQQNKQLTSELIADLKVIIKLHYCYRFDPQGIDRVTREKLKSATESWLAKYQNFNNEAANSSRENNSVKN